MENSLARLAIAALWVGALPVLAQPSPAIVPGAPSSPERLALIAALKSKGAAVSDRFEARTYRDAKGKTMPYRLFQPSRATTAKLPLVVYLHGAGGSGDDNRQQVSGGNLFGSHVFALPENQKRYPCYIVAPQSNEGWANYSRASVEARRSGKKSGAPMVLLPGLGEGARMALEIIEVLRKELPIDEKRIYVTGQSMGGMGTWHMIAERPALFAAAVPVCGRGDAKTIAAAVKVPLWNFHGDEDKTVPVEGSRQMIEALRKAGGKPVHTEYPGVGHNSWEWAYSEPALLPWIFAQHR